MITDKRSHWSIEGFVEYSLDWGGESGSEEGGQPITNIKTDAGIRDGRWIFANISSQVFAIFAHPPPIYDHICQSEAIA